MNYDKNIRNFFFIGVITILLLLPATVSSVFLDDLEDVTISSVQDNQFIRYDTASANWTNEAVTIFDGFYTSLDFTGTTGLSDGIDNNDGANIGMTGHPHDQDLNSTSNPSFPTVGIEDYYYHVADTDTSMYFLSDNIYFTTGGLNFMEFTESLSDEVVFNEDSNSISFRVENNVNTNMFNVDSGDEEVGFGIATSSKSGSTGYFYDSDEDCWVQVESDKVNSNAGFRLMNDVQTWNIYMNPAQDDRFELYDVTNTDFTFSAEKNMNDYAIYLNSPAQVCMFSTTGSIGYELDVNGDAEFASHRNACDKRAKDIIYVLDELPNNKILELCRLIDFVVFRWKDPLLKDLETNDSYLPFYSDGYGIGPIAQDLYYQLINFTSNPSINEKLASSIVGVGNDTVLWNVDKDAIFMIYARGWQINDERITVLEGAVFG